MENAGEAKKINSNIIPTPVKVKSVEQTDNKGTNKQMRKML